MRRPRLLASLEQGLPDVKTFEKLEFAEPTKVYDRDHKRVLATFFAEDRKVVQFNQIPQLILDATTAVEDRTFWENQGYDLQSTVFASLANLTGAADRGGASTITQQLVRAVLLPKALLAPGADLYERKAKELIQSAKLTEAFPGEEGKQRIITAYLNQIFYGHNAYGIAAAAKAYFGKTDVAADPAARRPCWPACPSPRPTSTRTGPRTPRRSSARARRTSSSRPASTARTSSPSTPTAWSRHPVVRRDFILRALLDGYRQVDQAHQGPGPRGAQRAHHPRRGHSPTTTWRPTSWSP